MAAEPPFLSYVKSNDNYYTIDSANWKADINSVTFYWTTTPQQNSNKLRLLKLLQ